MIRRIVCVLLDWRVTCVCARKCTFVGTSDRGVVMGTASARILARVAGTPPPEKLPVEDTGFAPG